MKRPVRQRAVRLMLDSGAFSAWFNGVDLSIKDYIKYIEDHQTLVDTYVALDVIPGSKGRMDRSQAAIEKSATASYRNLQVMKDAGLSPIPVFHQGERFHWLEKMLADGETYIGISPYLRSSQSEIITWMDTCFTMVTDKSGAPLVKTHGFGATGINIIRRYPWCTVDSTTWALASGYGMIRVPLSRGSGVFDFNRSGPLIYVGGAGLSKGQKKLCLDDLSPLELDCVLLFIKACGLTLGDVRNDPYARQITYIKYYEMLTASLPIPLLFRHRRSSFGAAVSDAQVSKDMQARIVYATGTSYSFAAGVLTRAGVADRLLSYYLLRKLKSRATLEAYVSNGYVGDANPLDRRESPVTNWDKAHYTDFRRRSLTARMEGLDEQEAVA